MNDTYISQTDRIMSEWEEMLAGSPTAPVVSPTAEAPTAVFTEPMVSSEAPISEEVSEGAIPASNAMSTVSPIVLQALRLNIEFKRSELNAGRNRIRMHVSGQDSARYRSIVKGFNRSDYILLNAFLRSILNADGQSIIQDGMDYNQCIYMILNEICLMILNEDSTVTAYQSVEIQPELLHAYCECYQGYKKSIESDETDPTLIQSNKANARAQLKNMNMLINKVGLLSQLNSGMRAIFPKVQDFKKLLIKSNDLMDRNAREKEEFFDELQRQLDLMTRVLQMEESGVDVPGVPCHAAIYKSVSFPSFQGEQRGFTYVCGRCGKQHFMTKPPFIVHHIPNFNPEYDLTRISNDPPDPIAAEALTFDPVVCPDCNAVNLFSAEVIKQLKVLVLYDMKQGRYKAVGKDATSELNLGHSNIYPVFADSPTEIVASEKEEVIVSNNPLDTELDEHLANFVKFVQVNRDITKITTNTVERHIQWLKYLYQIQPLVDIATDEFSFVMSACVAAGYTPNDIYDFARKVGDLNIHQTADAILLNVHRHMNDVVYKDISITMQYEDAADAFTEKVEQRLTDIAEVSGNEASEIQKIVDGIMVNIEHGVDLDALKITPFNTEESKDILCSGLFQELWARLQSHYVSALTRTIADIICARPNSKIFMQGKFGGTATDQMKSINRVRAASHLPRISVEIPDTAERVVALLNSFMEVSNIDAFLELSGAKLELLPKHSKACNIPYGGSYQNPDPKGDDKVEDWALKQCSDIFKEEIGYDVLLTGKDMDYIVQDLTREENGMDAEQLTRVVYTVGYLFATCVPTHNRGYLAIQKLILDTLTGKAEHDREVLEGMGVEYI